jgi:hypothetical protein
MIAAPLTDEEIALIGRHGLTLGQIQWRRELRDLFKQMCALRLTEPP